MREKGNNEVFYSEEKKKDFKKDTEGELLAEEKRVINIFIQASPSVVFIKNATLVPDNIREVLGVEGSMILEVHNNGAADKAGLKGTKRDYFGRVVFRNKIQLE